MNTNSSLSTFFVIIPLLAGSAIYVLWRSSSLLMFHWFDWCGLSPCVVSLRSHAGRLSDRLPEWLLYSWPDAAWVLSGVLCLAFIWRGSEGKAKHAWIFLTPVIAMVSELAQWLRVLPGTFDPADVAACGVATLAGVLTANRLYTYEI